MNQEAIFFHLREAKEELDRTIDEVAANPSYDYGEFLVAMSHLQHPINTAWNARDTSLKRHRACAHEDFDAWRRFPSLEELLIE